MYMLQRFLFHSCHFESKIVRFFVVVTIQRFFDFMNCHVDLLSVFFFFNENCRISFSSQSITLRKMSVKLMSNKVVEFTFAKKILLSSLSIIANCDPKNWIILFYNLISTHDDQSEIYIIIALFFTSLPMKIFFCSNLVTLDRLLFFFIWQRVPYKENILRS